MTPHDLDLIALFLVWMATARLAVWLAGKVQKAEDDLARQKCLIKLMAKRIAAQSQLLSKRAERDR